MAKSGRSIRLFLALGMLALASCAKEGPEPMAYGKDSCANCGMVAGDVRYGAEVITRRGKIFKFDSVECLARYLDQKRNDSDSLWVVDSGHPSHLIDATRAFYLQSDELPSPMGLNLSAYGRREEAAGVKERHAGAVLTWAEMRDYVRQRRN